MSLWTPGGEHKVPKEPESSGEGAAPGASGAGAGGGDDPTADLSPEDRERAEEMAGQMSEVREQLASAPAAVVVANHAMGLYELAAIHLSKDPPAVDEAKIAIDGFSALVGELEGRLGEDESTLNDALNQIKMAFVQIQGRASGEGAEAEGTAGARAAGGGGGETS